MNPYQSSAAKRDQIRQMFNNIAPTYDLLNHLLSFGVDRHWRNCVVQRLKKRGSTNILDVATGTGDLAIALADNIKAAHVVGADLSQQMVEIARSKVTRGGLTDKISLQVADVEQMPFSDNQFDAVTVAFGVRNFQNIELGLNEIFRVVEPGGELVVLEFSTPRNKIFGTIYRFYFHRVLPMVGGWLSKDRKAYSYLPNSVDEFPSPKKFLEIMQSVGFDDCNCKSLFGGVAMIYSGTKIKI